MKPNSLKAHKTSVSLFDEELKIIARLSKKRRYYNFSLALRQIVNEWNAAQDRPESDKSISGESQ
jgi:hypothetical protein